MAACLVLWATPARAQSLALTGRVTDPQGGVIADADVSLLRGDGAILRAARSDARGAYRIDGLTASSFVIQVDKAGFRRHVASLTLGGAARARDTGDAADAGDTGDAGVAAGGRAAAAAAGAAAGPAAGGAGATYDAQLSVAGVDDSVVVTGAGRPQSIGETSKAVSIIDRQEIAARNAATLTEIVRFTPGVQVRDNGGPGQFASMRIRGLRSDAAAVLVDGMRLRDASTTQGDVTSFLSNLNFVAAERVEVLRGSGSSHYGTNAVGGVVNIVTAAGGAPLRGDAQIEGGSQGTFRTRGALNGGALDNRLAYSAGVLQRNVTEGLDGDDAARSTGGQGMVRYQWSPATTVTGRLFGSNDRVALNASPTASGVPDANIPNEIIVEAIPVAPDEIARFNAGQAFAIGGATYIPGRNDPDSRRSSWFVTGAAQLQHVRSDRVSWQGSYQRVHTNRVFRNGPGGPGFQAAAESFGNYVGDIDTVDARVVLQPTGWLDVAAGYELEHEGYFDRQDNNLPASARVATRTRISQYANTGYASANLALLGRRLQLSLAGRLQQFDLRPVDLEAVGTDNAYAPAEIAAPPRALTGDVSLAYLFDRSKTKLRTHTGNAYRAPALYERFGGGFSASPTTGEILFTAYGDPRLEPDRYRTVDAGVDQYLWRDRVLASATVFYIDVASLSAFDSSGGLNPATDPFGRSIGYVNGSGGFSRGVELSADVRPSARLRVSASYTYTRAETDRDITVPGFSVVPGVFGHTATLVMTNRWTDRLDTTVDLFHGSASYGSFFAAGRSRAYRYPGFTKAALIGRVRLAGSDARPVRAYVKVDNLFDEIYYQGGWLSLGRTVVAGVSAGF